MSAEYAAVVADEEHAIQCHPKRDVAIALAMEPLIEDVDAGNNEPGAYTVVVYTAPEWCQKQQRFCEEHDHEEHAQWLTGWALEETVEVLVSWDSQDADLASADWEEATQ